MAEEGKQGEPYRGPPRNDDELLAFMMDMAEKKGIMKFTAGKQIAFKNFKIRREVMINNFQTARDPTLICQMMTNRWAVFV